MILTKTNAMILLVAIATLGAVVMSSATPAHANGPSSNNPGQGSCTDRGLISPGCTPGQHVNTQGQGISNDIVGNPHYPQIGGPTTGDPHGSTACNPQTGNPHHGTSLTCSV
jgi:hypothetical protein